MFVEFVNETPLEVHVFLEMERRAPRIVDGRDYITPSNHERLPAIFCFILYSKQMTGALEEKGVGILFSLAFKELILFFEGGLDGLPLRVSNEEVCDRALHEHRRPSSLPLTRPKCPFKELLREHQVLRIATGESFYRLIL